MKWPPLDLGLLDIIYCYSCLDEHLPPRCTFTEDTERRLKAERELVNRMESATNDNVGK